MSDDTPHKFGLHQDGDVVPVRVNSTGGQASVVGLRTDGLPKPLALIETMVHTLRHYVQGQHLMEIEHDGQSAAISTRLFAQSALDMWDRDMIDIYKELGVDPVSSAARS